MSNRIGDALLVEQALAGCLDSFEQLVARYQVPLVQFLVQRTGSVEDAEDLTQETMVRAYQNLYRYRSAWQFSTWLFTIARRLYINHQRHTHAQCRDCAREQPDGLSQIEGSDDDPSHRMSNSEDHQRLWALAASVLNEQKFTVLWLYYVEEMPILEIARALGRSRVAVKTMLFRSRKQLMPVFERQLSETASPAIEGQAGMYDQLAERMLVTRRLLAEASGG